MAGEWQLTLTDGTFDNVNADRIFITPSGCVLFSDTEGKQNVIYLALSPGEWKKVQRVDTKAVRP